MTPLRIAIYVFITLELSNILIMYFKPQFKYGNSMNTFDSFEDSKTDEASYLFAKYMTNWVANCKLIFIGLLFVIALIGDIVLLRFAVGSMVISIGIYFITLHPIIVKLDKLGKINPKGYSKTLAFMIIAFMAMFASSLIMSYYM